MRASPIANCIAPTRKVTVSARLSNRCCRGRKRAEACKQENRDHVGGPDTRWRDDPNSAATMRYHGRVEPVLGGRPASVANAMPCGRR